MGLFNSKDNDTPRNPNTFFTIRLLAAGYLLWMVKDLVQMYIKGGSDAPSLPLLLLAAVLFIGGAAWILWASWKQYKQMKEAQAAEFEAEIETPDEESPQE